MRNKVIKTVEQVQVGDLVLWIVDVLNGNLGAAMSVIDEDTEAQNCFCHLREDKVITSRKFNFSELVSYDDAQAYIAKQMETCEKPEKSKSKGK